MLIADQPRINLVHAIDIIGYGCCSCIYEVELPGSKVVNALLKITPNLHSKVGREFEITPRLIHPNVVRCVATAKLLHGKYTFECLLLEAYGLGYDELICSRVRSNAQPWHMVLQEVNDMCAAVDYIHSIKWTHGDIKPSNFVQRGRGCARLVLIDFGFAARVNIRKNGYKSTPLYTAPELIVQDDLYNIEVTYSLDMWSLGITFVNALFQCYPYPDFVSLESMQHFYANLLRSPDPYPLERFLPPVFEPSFNNVDKAIRIPLRFYNDLVHLIKCILSLKPEFRMSARTLLQVCRRISVPTTMTDNVMQRGDFVFSGS
jgi:serine/threonine protein kinase